MGTKHSARASVRWGHGAAALGLLALVAGARAEGSTLRAQEAPITAHTGAEYALTNAHAFAQPLRVVGDYYFVDPATSSLGPMMTSVLGGFRASTGVVGLAQPTPLYATRPEGLQSLPYIGLGYSHLWIKSQLSLNADFGLASGVHGRTLLTGNQALDDIASQLRWAPVMGVNLRYSF